LRRKRIVGQNINFTENLARISLWAHCGLANVLALRGEGSYVGLITLMSTGLNLFVSPASCSGGLFAMILHLIAESFDGHGACQAVQRSFALPTNPFLAEFCNCSDRVAVGASTGGTLSLLWSLNRHLNTLIIFVHFFLRSSLSYLYTPPHFQATSMKPLFRVSLMSATATSSNLEIPFSWTRSPTNRNAAMLNPRTSFMPPKV